ncbi:MAG: YbbR-like domain-containing protein [Bacillus sp. (in: firmicutes)]
MDKLIETPWFVKVIALSLAALLFISVNFETNNESILNTPSEKDTELVENVPVEVYYDRDNLVVTGVPKTVDVKLQGPKNILIPAATQQDFQVYIDLSDPEIELGTQEATIKIRDLNEKISYTISPDTVEVSVQEKITKTFAVEPEYDRTLLAEGYIAEEPKVTPGHVKITGAKDIVEKIAYVKAVINIKADASETVYKDVQVQALDRDLNKLPVAIEPGVVEVKVPIKSPTKRMKIEPVASGEPKTGIEISSITAEPSEITLFGKKSVLDAIDAFQIPVDVSKVEKNVVYTLPVDLPEGIKGASVEEVKVNISVTKSKEEDNKKEEEDQADNNGNPEEGTNSDNNDDNNDNNSDREDEQRPPIEETNATRTFSNIPIQYSGLGEEYELAFVSPSQGVTNVSVTGKQSELNSLKASDMQVVMQVDGLQEGEHTISLKLNHPANIEGKTAVSSARVSITKKATENN